jgi:hypothetical protein
MFFGAAQLIKMLQLKGAAIVEDDIVYFSNYTGPAYSSHKNEIKNITPG